MVVGNQASSSCITRSTNEKNQRTKFLYICVCVCVSVCVYAFPCKRPFLSQFLKIHQISAIVLRLTLQKSRTGTSLLSGKTCPRSEKRGKCVCINKTTCFHLLRPPHHRFPANQNGEGASPPILLPEEDATAVAALALAFTGARGNHYPCHPPYHSPPPIDPLRIQRKTNLWVSSFFLNPTERHSIKFRCFQL